jgi:sugar transferase EpsL
MIHGKDGKGLFVKRVLDLGLASLGLILASPFMALTAVVVRISLGRPVLYRQGRSGLCCRPFTLFKFRTMTQARGQDGKLLPAHRRLTPVGRVIRRMSLDELPQLINVLKGDMSLVGPRPLPTEYVPFYSQDQLRRHCVRPGITGWAQVNGRTSITWDEKFALDLWYVDKRSLELDLKILALTAIKVLMARDIDQTNETTFQPFRGTPSDNSPSSG